MREPVGQCGVGEPGSADSQEADDVGHVGGPGMKHLLQRCARRVNRDVQHEQRDGDGEHAVAECLHPALAENSARTSRVSGCWHDIASFAACRHWRQPYGSGRSGQRHAGTTVTGGEPAGRSARVLACRSAGSHGSRTGSVSRFVNRTQRDRLRRERCRRPGTTSHRRSAEVNAVTRPDSCHFMGWQ